MGELSASNGIREVVLLGNRTELDALLNRAGLQDHARPIRPQLVKKAYALASATTSTIADIREQSGRYLKLTSEAYEKFQEAGGLMPTAEDGESYAMLGVPGHVSSWLKVVTPGGLDLGNPAVLNGLGKMLTQASREDVASQMREAFNQLNTKVDAIRRTQLDEYLNELKAAESLLERVTVIREDEGDVAATWDVANGQLAVIRKVGNQAVSELIGLAERGESTARAGQLKQAADSVRSEAGLWLAVISKCHELEDEFNSIELDYVEATKPSALEGHRRGIARDAERRDDEIRQRTGQVLLRLERLADQAQTHSILHPRNVPKALAHLDAAAGALEEIRGALGMHPEWEPRHKVLLRDALRDQEQLKVAGKQIRDDGSRVLAAVVTVGAVASKVAAKVRDKP